MTEPRWFVHLAGTPHGYAAVEPHVAERLQQDGLLWQEGEQWWMQPETAYLLDAHPEHAICDFCGATPVVWRARAHEFDISPPEPLPDGAIGRTTSTGDWAACDACGRLIAAGERKALYTRVMAEMRAKPRLTRLPFGIMQREISALHAKFWRHYRGIVRFIQ